MNQVVSVVVSGLLGIFIAMMMFDNIGVAIAFGVSIGMAFYFAFSDGKTDKKDKL